MTQQSNLAELQSWWAELSFPGKELFTLNENGEIVLSQIAENKARTIATATIDQANALYKSLTDKFAELQAKLNELVAEWDTTEDKLKLAGKIEKLKDAIAHASALGNFDVFYNQFQAWDKVLNAAVGESNKVRHSIIEQAEKLADSDNWKETTQAFRDLVEQWKQIGNNAKGKTDALWNKLEEARNKFYERKRQNHESVEHELLQNLDLKMELVDKAEAIASSEEWKDTTEAFRKLMDEWKTIGRTMHDKNEELWQRFIAAKNSFFDKKKDHFDRIKKEQEENYDLKNAMVEKAIGLQESTDWANTTQAYAELMDEWKKTGRVPLEKADELWERFNAAKDHFFQAKRLHFDAIRTTLDENLAKKRELLQRTESLKNSNKWREVAIEMNTLMEEWKKIGAVPREHSNRIWEAFLAARKHFFDTKSAYFENKKIQAEKYEQGRVEQTRGLVGKLMEEIKEEEEKLVDFRSAIENITPGRKAEELRTHLQNLIAECEARIVRKQEKLEAAQKAVSDMDAKNKQNEESIAQQEEGPGDEATADQQQATE